MRTNQLDRTETNPPSTHRQQNAPSTLAVARAMIEREFSSLLEQQPHVLQLALNEAEALAWDSGFPELIFPTLAQEKANNVARWHQRQAAVRQITPIQAFAV